MNPSLSGFKLCTLFSNLSCAFPNDLYWLMLQIMSLLLFLLLIYWFLLTITVLDYTNLSKWTNQDKVTIAVLEDSDFSQFV